MTATHLFACAMPETVATASSLPLFPLNAVLFPESRLSLKIFEARYLDMIARCMQSNSNFGICLIKQGQEVGAPAEPHLVGVEARIVDWDMSVPNILGLTVKGERRFRILTHTADEAGLLSADVEWFADAPTQAVPQAYQDLLPLLALVIADQAKHLIPPPHRLDDAAWVGYRYAEILPIQALARQRLLELEDCDLRLSIIHAYLISQNLIKPNAGQA